MPFSSTGAWLGCPPHAHSDSDSGCVCDQDYKLSDDGQSCVCGTAQCMLEKESSGVLLKCTAEWLRRIYEPIPFCIRWAAYISAAMGLVSTLLGVIHIRSDLVEIRRLVEEYYDPALGFPQDPTILSDEEQALLGGAADGTLKYSNMAKGSAFIGLYAGNFVAAFIIFWFLWAGLLYLVFSLALPDKVMPLLWIMAPVVLEMFLRAAIWNRLVSPDRGITHPRLFGFVDLLFAVISAWTGPIKTVLRLMTAGICLLMHLYRSDISLMLDHRFVTLDPHYRATLGLLSTYRVQCEFEKTRREALDGEELPDDAVDLVSAPPVNATAAPETAPGDLEIQGQEAPSAPRVPGSLGTLDGVSQREREATGAQDEAQVALTIPTTIENQNFIIDDDDDDADLPDSAFNA